jgi:hypothetical protein
MACLVKRGETFSVRYKDRDGNAKKIALGVNDEKRAKVMLGHVEELIEAVRTDSRPARATEAWANKQEESLQLRLEKAGLVELADRKAKQQCTLGSFLDGYVKLRADVKGSTALVYGHTVRNLKAYFGENKPIRKITPGDADEFKLWLRTSSETVVELDGRRLNGQGLADGTANRRCTLAGQFFRAAGRKGLIKDNPFAGVGGAVRSNKARQYYLSDEDTTKIRRRSSTLVRITAGG